MFENSTNYKNYTCNVTMWWWDGTGTWDINASISDNDNLSTENSSTNFYLGTTEGFSGSPTNLTWASINPGATNQKM